ncbi:C39 family peptidase [Levilactobacillus mulengensis]|uniref:C39 family peptidase n=1 Tax=Levilactobacillus mulengensis TaxID=2486025 RepID=UPI001CDD0CF9|nr:C39 family peptidase [Levilactobacillus mulengensis]
MVKTSLSKRLLRNGAALLAIITVGSSISIPSVTPEPLTANAAMKAVPAKDSKSWKSFSHKVHFVKKDYKVYQDNWHAVSSSNKLFHKGYKANGKYKLSNGRTYYRLYNSKKTYLGYVNAKAVATNTASKVMKVPYVSQYKPVFAPWGCASAAMSMLLRYRGVKVNLRYAQNHLPMVPTKGGQKGNVYTGVGFGHVITAAALTKYSHHWTKRTANISKASANDIKMYVQGGYPVLFYGYSSYQKNNDKNRNHCKVIVGYKNGKFKVNDPLYYSSTAKAGTGGKNMKYDHGAISWESISHFKKEYGKHAMTIY